MRTIAALGRNFLGNAPGWYKIAVIACLVLNPFLLKTLGPFTTGWIILGEFIFTLAMSLKAYPLPVSGLIALEALLLRMTGPEVVYHEIEKNVSVILLLMFMVTGIVFLRDLLLVIFSNILVGVRNKVVLSLLFCALGAGMSAFLDALTVTSVVMSVAVGMYAVYHRFASMRGEAEDHDSANDDDIHEDHSEELNTFRSFMRGLIMHFAVGTALGGVATQVGEPQNVIIAGKMGWNFVEFFQHVAPVSIPVLIAGLTLCFALEYWSGFGRIFGYGAKMPENVRNVIRADVVKQNGKRDPSDNAKLIAQGIVALGLVYALATHVAEVGLIGIFVIVIVTAFTGVVEEHRIGHAFTESLPFTALIVVFFVIIGVIHDQELFGPIIAWTLGFEGKQQLLAFFTATGSLSTGSDNVFVASVYIAEAEKAFNSGLINRVQYELVAVAINTGTNLPSVATPNGQAAFLFLLTSQVAGLIRLSYVRMMWLAFPYFVVMTSVAMLAIWFLL